jgi:CRP-like cAMP-binding protein
MNQPATAIIASILQDFLPVSPNTISLVINSGEIVNYERGNVVIYEKKYNAFEYFQLEGIAHRYNLDADAQQITTGIYQAPTVITPHFARTTDSKSIFCLQALTDCTFLRIPIGTFDELRNTHEQLRAFGQRVSEREFIHLLNYEVLFRTYSAKDRLLFFRSKFPLLENRIPHTVIASLLGITPVSFSRLRNELSKKK